ncbi:MAG: hypothetical protein E7353_05550 [Clostridiales bacterium]|nr:hypothetical protein [Clostridiales bacterium]
MLKLVSLLLIPTLMSSVVQNAKPGQAVDVQEPCKYETVMEQGYKCEENCDTYAENSDKSVENRDIRTLEEFEKWDREKKPFAKIVVKIQSEKRTNEKTMDVSGEETKPALDIFLELEEKFEYMFKLKEKIDEYERECAKLWSEYYAIKDVYDRALAKYSENWAEDNGISFIPKRVFAR